MTDAPTPAPSPPRPQNDWNLRGESLLDPVEPPRLSLLSKVVLVVIIVCMIGVALFALHFYPDSDCQ